MFEVEHLENIVFRGSTIFHLLTILVTLCESVAEGVWSNPHQNFQKLKKKISCRTKKQMSKTRMRLKQFQKHQTKMQTPKCSPLQKKMICRWKLNIDRKIITLFEVEHLQFTVFAEAPFFYI